MVGKSLKRLWQIILVLGICSQLSSGTRGDGKINKAEQAEIDDLEEELDEELRERHFTNEWAIHVEGGDDVANAVARDLGYDNYGQVSQLEF